MRNFTAHAVHAIIEHCLELQIGNLVIGDWEDMKRGLKMGEKNFSVVSTDTIRQIQREFEAQGRIV